MYTYEITATLKERGKEDSIRLNFGSLYAVMKNLLKYGFIAEEQTERAGNRPERTVYSITTSGRIEALDWLSEILAKPSREYPDFEAGLSLMPMLAPTRVLLLLSERLAALNADIESRDLKRANQEFQQLPEVFLIEFDYRLAMMRAEQAFITDLTARLAQGSFGGQQLWAKMHELLDAGKPKEEVAAMLSAELSELGLDFDPLSGQKPKHV